MLIGNKKIGYGEPVYIIAEIGINHNGDMNIAKQLIDMAVDCGCDAVKFQKRDISLCFTKEELESKKDSHFGNTYREYKEGLEFSLEQYKEIDHYCKRRNIHWSVSCWDIVSLNTMLSTFNLPFIKVASANATDRNILKLCKKFKKPVIVSTGCMNEETVMKTMSYLDINNTVLLHCVSLYPCPDDKVNLRAMDVLDQYCMYTGYSGHEKGIMPTVAAVQNGACVIERHITLDRTMWGSDHAASLEYDGLHRLVRDVRNISKVYGKMVKEIIDGEEEKMKTLRKVNNL